MSSQLLSLLENSLTGRLRLHELRGGVLHGEAARARVLTARTAPHGAYLLARAPTVPELWAALRASRAVGVPLVLLPPLSLPEENLLLSQLPAEPPAHAALVLFNQGSRQQPRAVFHSEESLLVSARQLHAAFAGNGPTCSLVPAWGMSSVLFQCLLPALRGSDVLYGLEDFSTWAPLAGRLFKELSLELLTLTPSQLEVFLREGLEHGWRGQVITLAAPLRRAALARYALASGRRPHEIYGMMEAAGPVLLNGKSLGAEIRISQRYELEIRGPQLFLGYGISGKFCPREEWFRTGDIFTDEDGVYLHQAREPAAAL